MCVRLFVQECSNFLTICLWLVFAHTHTCVRKQTCSVILSYIRGASRWVSPLPVLQSLPARGLLVHGGGEQSQSDPRRDKTSCRNVCMTGYNEGYLRVAGGRGRNKDSGTLTNSERVRLRVRYDWSLFVVEDSWFSPVAFSHNLTYWVHSKYALHNMNISCYGYPGQNNSFSVIQIIIKKSSWS